MNTSTPHTPHIDAAPASVEHVTRRLQEAFEHNPAIQMLVNMATPDAETRRLAYQTLAKVAAEALYPHST